MTMKMRKEIQRSTKSGGGRLAEEFGPEWNQQRFSFKAVCRLG